MSRAAGEGFAAALASLASNVPTIYQSYLDNETERKKIENKLQGRRVLREYDYMFPETPEAAKTPEAPALPDAKAAAPPDKVPAATEQMAGTPQVAETATKERWKKAMSETESGNNYGAVGPRIDKFKGKGAGYRALGKYQIMPVYHFKKIGLDSTKQADINKFLNTPALQDKLYGIVTDEMWDSAGGDPRKATARYYGSGSSKAVPTVEGGKAMPTGEEHWAKVSAKMGVPAGPGTAARTSSLMKVQSEGYVTDALKELIADKPKKPGDLKGRTTKKLDYFYSQATPEMIEAMEPTLKALEHLSKSERDDIQEEWQRYDQEADRWARGVITAASLGAGIKKTEMKQSGKLGKEDIQKLKLKAQLIQRQMVIYKDVAKNYAKGKGSQRKRIEDEYPDLFKNKKRGFWGELFNSDPEKVIDTFHITRLQKELDDINAQLAGSTGLPAPEQRPGSLPSTGGGTARTEGTGNIINRWITD